MPKEITITRIFDAPRNLVWKAWSNPELIKKWWGPKDFTSPECQIDMKVGGKYVFCMQSPDGEKYYSAGSFLEIVPMEKIVYTDAFSDEKGNIVSPTKYGMPESFPLEMLVTIKLEDEGDKTKMTLTHSGIENMDPVDVGNMEIGWGESFDKMSTTLNS